MTSPVRVRFAPSPTGYLHVGGLRTALYNYAFARRHGGVFILRIEDTDRSRYVAGAEEKLIESLDWCGLAHDEGPEIGGPHAPYRQSERLPIYREAVDRLLAQGHAYPCFCTEARLKEMRLAQQKAKLDPKYDRTCLQLSSAEAASLQAAGRPFVIRMRIPDDEIIAVSDLVRGEVEFATIQIDDQVLLKSDGFPTYHLANVVDDHAMEITHVIRGEEWLSSMPKHILLYRYLGLEAPQFAHLPLLLGTDRSKLSKRQADVAVSDYRDQGYFPEALLNFVAFLGWNPGDERELFSLEEFVREFSLERVNKSGAIFNTEKLRWYNEAWMRHRPIESILRELRPLLAERGWGHFSDEYILRMIELMRERVGFIREYPVAAAWFFEDPVEYEPAARAKRWRDQSAGLISRLVPGLQSLPGFNAAALEETIRAFAAENAVQLGDVIHPLRLACSGVGGGPGLYDLMELLGRETCLRRIRRAIDLLG